MDKTEWILYLSETTPVPVGEFLDDSVAQYAGSPVQELVRKMLAQFLKDHVPITNPDGSWSGPVSHLIDSRHQESLAMVRPVDIRQEMERLRGMLPDSHPLLEAVQRQQEAAPPPQEKLPAPLKLTPVTKSPEQVEAERKAAKAKERRIRQHMALDLNDSDPNGSRRGICAQIVDERSPGLRESDPKQWRKDVEKLRAYLNEVRPRKQGSRHPESGAM